MNFVSFEEVEKVFRGKSVAIVGSAPSVLDNKPGFIDSHDIVVRINNYKLSDNAGFRNDVYYSFFGTSVKKEKEELIKDGVKLCMCKCPNSKPIESKWHEKHHKPNGVDFRYIYEFRKDFWFCDTFIPDDEHFLEVFNLLGQHTPSTGFSALMDILSFDCSIYMTGFDFFTSGIHNVDEPWRFKNESNPIGHSPNEERKWLRKNYRFRNIHLDKRLHELTR